MGTEPFAQSRDPQPEQPLRPVHAPVQPLTVAEALALPALNGPDIICRLEDFSRSQFHRLDREGAFDFLKVSPAVGPRCFSGVLIARWLCREAVFEPTFGRKRAR